MEDDGAPCVIDIIDKKGYNALMGLEQESTSGEAAPEPEAENRKGEGRNVTEQLRSLRGKLFPFLAAGLLSPQGTPTQEAAQGAENPAPVTQKKVEETPRVSLMGIEELIHQLDSDDFRMRESAHRALIAQGSWWIDEVIERNYNLEQKMRLQHIRKSIRRKEAVYKWRQSHIDIPAAWTNKGNRVPLSVIIEELSKKTGQEYSTNLPASINNTSIATKFSDTTPWGIVQELSRQTGNILEVRNNVYKNSYIAHSQQKTYMAHEGTLLGQARIRPAPKEKKHSRLNLTFIIGGNLRLCYWRLREFSAKTKTGNADIFHIARDEGEVKDPLVVDIAKEVSDKTMNIDVTLEVSAFTTKTVYIPDMKRNVEFKTDACTVYFKGIEPEEIEVEHGNQHETQYVARFSYMTRLASERDDIAIFSASSCRAFDENDKAIELMDTEWDETPSMGWRFAKKPQHLKLTLPDIPTTQMKLLRFEGIPLR